MKNLISNLSIVALTTVWVSSTVFAAPSDGRWCQVGGVTRSDFRGSDGKYSRVPDSLTATCDGYSTSGSLADASKVNQVTIELYPDEKSSSRKSDIISLAIPGLTASDVADNNFGKSEQFKSKVVAALAERKPPITNRSSFNIVAIEVDSSAVLYDNSKKKMVPLPEVRIDKPSEVIKDLQIDGQPFAAEIACISQMKKLPSSGIYTAVNKGNDSSSAAVITGKPDGNKIVDLVVVPSGILINEYPKGLRDVDSEHFVEVPAFEKGKKAVAYYHSVSDQGSSSAFFDEQPYQQYRPKKVLLDSSKLATDKSGKAHQLLNSAILDYTKQYREQFDRDPRLKSKTNLTLLRNALNSCMEVPGLMEANNGEMGFFEDYIYRDQRELFPKRTVVKPSGGGKQDEGTKETGAVR